MSDGARFSRMDKDATAVRMGDAQVRSPALEGNPVELNLDFAGAENKPEAVPVAGLKALAQAVEAEAAKHGLAGKVTPRVVRGLLGASGVPIQGRQAGNVIEVNPAASDGVVGVMRHEIVHALRDKGRWDAPFGLFTRAEWLGLVSEAKADTALTDRIKGKYGDKSPEVQTEEAVAETYRLWVQGLDMAGPVAKAFAKVRAYLMAVANALRGQGFQSAALTMERIASGTIGGRGPDGGKESSSSESEMRQSARDQISAFWNGSKPDAPIVIGKLFPVFSALTGKENQLVIASSVIKKAGNHGLTEADVLNAIDGLDDPVMVFDSKNETGSLTALVAVAAQDGRPIVVAIDTNFRAVSLEVSRIATIHGKDHPEALIGWMKEGYLRYINKQKAGAWARSIGRQLPKDMESSHQLGMKILQHSDVFKPNMDPSESRFDLAPIQAKFRGLIGSRNWNANPQR